MTTHGASDLWSDRPPPEMWDTDRHGLYLGLEIVRRLRGEPSLPPYDQWAKGEKRRRK